MKSTGKRTGKISLIICMFCMLMLFAAACGKEEEAAPAPQLEIEPIKQQEEEEPEPEVEEEEEPESEETTIGEREEVDGKIQSYLTGQWTKTEQATRRPIAVMIPNNTPALPQYGLSRAAVIYEAPVEGRITRLMGVFENFDDLDRIGPVRSSRDYYVYQAMGYEAIYCNWGLAVP